MRQDATPRTLPGVEPHSLRPAGQLTVLAETVPPPSQLNDSIVVGLAIFGAACALTFGAALTFGGPLELYGTALGLGLLSISYATRRYFADRFPDVEAIEPRLQLSAADGDPGHQDEDLADLPEVQAVGRRPLLRRILLGAGAVFGISALAPVATLGPRPGDRLRATAWTPGRRLVTSDGDYLRADDLASGGVSTVWPEGAIGNEKSATVAIRLSVPPREGTNPDWIVDQRVVCYSKICTHAGCPVALFREQDNALFCPCHQSTFDVTRGAVPTFGPAARALPQLPLGVDDEGYLIATADFVDQVGPAYD